MRRVARRMLLHRNRDGTISRIVGRFAMRTLPPCAARLTMQGRLGMTALSARIVARGQDVSQRAERLREPR